MTAEQYGPLNGARIAVMGITYREMLKKQPSQVLSLIKEIKDQGGTAVIHDPLFTENEILSLGLEPYQLGDP